MMARKIIYVQYSNPAAYPPLEHSSRLLANEGWQILFVGTGAFGAKNLEFPPHPNIIVRRLTFVQSGWRQKLHYFLFIVWVMSWTLRWRASWVYASDHLSCPIGLVLSYLPGLQVIYHEHDTPTVKEDAQISGFSRFVGWTRHLLALRARLSILPNKQRADKFTQQMPNGKQAITIWNCPMIDEVAPERPTFKGEDLWLLYQGSIVPARLPLAVLTALAQLPSQIKLRIIGYETVGHKGYVKQLLDKADQLGLGNRVEFLGAISRYELLRRCQECDIGLAFMPTVSCNLNEQAMVGASNKPFDYLACGVALLVSDLPDWRETYVNAGYGVACNPDDPSSIAAALHWYLEHPNEMREMGELGRQRILDEWNYERQFAPVAKIINYGNGTPQHQPD